MKKNELTAQIVTAYLAKNVMEKTELPDFIKAINMALSTTDYEITNKPIEVIPVPHIPIEDTISDDYLVSLENRRHYKSLKRHLSAVGLTPDDYRRKWGLPRDYPMVAPSLSRKRSAVARRAFFQD